MLPRVTARSDGIPAVRVCVELGSKRAFATALDWPGWCRAGRDEAAALAALEDYATRYSAVAEAAGVSFAVGDRTVVERLEGTPTTDFGAPDRAAAAETEPMTAAQARRMASLVAAAWTVFDAVVAGAPAALRKGPRGGGRDRDAMVDHVLAAEHAYARKLGIRVAQPHIGSSPPSELRPQARHWSSEAGCRAMRRGASRGTSSTTRGRWRTAAESESASPARRSSRRRRHRTYPRR